MYLNTKEGIEYSLNSANLLRTEVMWTSLWEEAVVWSGARCPKRLPFRFCNRNLSSKNVFLVLSQVFLWIQSANFLSIVKMVIIRKFLCTLWSGRSVFPLFARRCFWPVWVRLWVWGMGYAVLVGTSRRIRSSSLLSSIKRWQSSHLLAKNSAACNGWSHLQLISD